MTIGVAPGAASIVKVGGSPVLAAVGPIKGGFLTNPLTVEGQAIGTVEPLFFNLVGDAALAAGGNTFQLNPGDTFQIPDDLAMGAFVSVNAATSGHQFSVVIFSGAPPYPPTPVPSDFPPAGPPLLADVIPSYLYQEYNDDDDMISFVDAYNELAQQYVDWFNQISLPYYLGDLIAGQVLDWVGANLYGLPRQTLASGRAQNIGPYDTFTLDSLVFNGYQVIGQSNFYLTTDDIYRRILTWHLYKADGKVFDIRWLKRRVMRFLIGVNGTAPNIDQTYLIDVQIASAIVTITIDNTDGSFTEVASFVAAIESGVLELPFQYTYTVVILT